MAADGLKVRLAKVLQCLPEEEEFLVRSGVGWRAGVVGHARVGGDLGSPAGYAFRTGQPVLTNDLTSEPRFRTPALLVEHGVVSAINVLIRSNGEAFGVLEVDSTHRGDFREADLAFLQTLANTLSVAIRAQKREDAKAEMLREKEALLRDNERLLSDKDMLMREVHHRVTNSLQLVHSALVLQLKSLHDREARSQISDAAARVLAIAAVHRRLYQGNSAVIADASLYLRGLLEEMKTLLPSSSDRRLMLAMEDVMLSADDLVHLGLIAVELITNALKHGRGDVQVAVERSGDTIRMSVADQGDGFPASFDPRAQAGLGYRIVSSLARSDDPIVVDRSASSSRVVVTMALSTRQ